MLNKNVYFRYSKKKEPRGSLFECLPYWATPIENVHIIFNKRNPRGITFGYATRDHCFVIASEGVTKKEP